jgi:hypothetical protein
MSSCRSGDVLQVLVRMATVVQNRITSGRMNVTAKRTEHQQSQHRQQIQEGNVQAQLRSMLYDLRMAILLPASQPERGQPSTVWLQSIDYLAHPFPISTHSKL